MPKVIGPAFSVENPSEIDEKEILRRLERAGRTCYKSEGRISDDSAVAFVRGLLKRGHESVIEHEKITLRIVCDRGVTHELVRHRLASYSQESTRYCNYSEDRFGECITVIKPCFWEAGSVEYMLWLAAMEFAEKIYFALLQEGVTPQEARSVLPNSLKTEIIITANLREWRHILRLRTSKSAHPQIREIMLKILALFREKMPILFGDIIAE